MSVTGAAVHWWEERQLRILVLCSLAIQILLWLFSVVRRLDIPRWFRSMAWLAYLGGDALAIYALATLFNRHKDKGCGGGGGGSSSSLLQVVWAPVLLIHLGGQDGITAYNIEDNELWSRHLLTAVSQVTVAIYVFSITWQPGGDKRLLQAAILLFVPGVLKCFAKPWALKRASIYSLVSSPATAKQKEGEMYPLEEYVKQAKTRGARASNSMEDEGRRQRREPAGTGTPNKFTEILEGYYEMSKLFVDLSCSYSCRLGILEVFWQLTEERAFGSVRRGLATTFLILYTRVKTTNIHDEDAEEDLFSLPLVYSRLFLPWAAIGLFHHSHREAYNHIDVKITYILLCCTAVLEFFSIGTFFSLTAETEMWPEMVAQCSFIGGYVARSTKHSSNRMRMVSLLLGCKQDQEADRWWSSREIAVLVHRHLKAGWKQKIHDDASYRSFNDNRGHWAIEGNEDHLGWSIKGPFDECVLRWHIATDLCFFMCPSSSDDKSVLCTQMSNYMAHLLLDNPEMLLPGSRRNLFKTAQQELDAIFNNSPPPGLDKRALAGKIIDKLQASSSSPPETFIHEAWRLAQKLQSLGDEKMWEVIQGVWVEMLCYSAGRCRGYLHAKALGQGGEFLSYVWLLLFHMGMETFTDKLQREDLPSHEAAGTGNNATTAPPSTSEQEQVLPVSITAPPSTSEQEQVLSVSTTAPPSTSEQEQVLSTTGASASEAHIGAAGVSVAPSTSDQEKVPCTTGGTGASASEAHGDAAVCTAQDMV